MQMLLDDSTNSHNTFNTSRDFSYLKCTKCTEDTFVIDDEYHDMVVCPECGFRATRFGTKKEHLQMIYA